MDWIIGLQKAIDYIENNLTETIDYEKVAAQSYSSSYHFQRVFSILCGLQSVNTSATADCRLPVLSLPQVMQK